MLESTEKSDLEGLKAWQRDYSSEFIFPPVASGSGAGTSAQLVPSVQSSTLSGIKDEGQSIPDVIELSSDEDEDGVLPACDVQLLPKGGTAATSSIRDSNKSTTNGHTSVSRLREANPAGIGTWPQASEGDAVGSTTQRRKLAYGGLVQQEISTRTKESLGLNAPGVYRLGGAASRAPSTSPNLLADNSRRTLTHTGPPSLPADASTLAASTESDWACQVCTLYAYIPIFPQPASMY